MHHNPDELPMFPPPELDSYDNADIVVAPEADEVLKLLHDTSQTLDIDLGQADPQYHGTLVTLAPYYMKEGDSVGYWKVQARQAAEDGTASLLFSARLGRMQTPEGTTHALLREKRGLSQNSIDIATRAMDVLATFKQQPENVEMAQPPKVRQSILRRLARSAFTRILPSV